MDLQVRWVGCCMRLLPLVMETNLKALEARDPEHPALARYAEIAQILTENPDASAVDGVTWISELVGDLNIPALSAYGMTREHFSDVVEKTMKSSSYKGNPIPLTEAELLGILERAL